MQVFGALPTSSDVCDVDRLRWAGLQALGGIGVALSMILYKLLLNLKKKFLILLTSFQWPNGHTIMFMQLNKAIM